MANYRGDLGITSTSNPTNTSTLIIEGQSTSRPPFFNGSNYTILKIRMEFFLSSIDFDLWEMIEDGFVFPRDENGLPLPKKQWCIKEKRRYSLNCKAINQNFYALELIKFNRVSSYWMAKEMWDLLEATHKGTKKVKEMKINILIHS